MKSFTEKGIDVIKKEAEKNDMIENYHFLKHLINLQSLQKFDTITQFRKDYTTSLSNQIDKMRKRKAKK
tara:strand:- start:408 stop:614 length:207 start_codon:yes stop_codon:yes gene_type:complete